MNLVLCVVHGLEYDKLAPFFESFSAAKRDAEMHVFVRAVSPGSVKKMEAAGAVTHPFYYLNFRHRQPLLWFWPVWRRMLASRDFDGKRALGRKVFHLASVRFILYYDFLMARRKDFENVLLTDSRDVFFQIDPFSDRLGQGLHCFLEAKTQFIGKCSSNSNMLRGSLGPEVLAGMAEERVSCSGTTIGDVESIMIYLKEMIEISSRGPEMFGGSDQGVHNFIVHRNLVPGLRVHDNYDSTVFTAGCEPESALRWNDGNQIIRDDGKPYPILHQYDRIATIRERVHSQLQHSTP